MWLRVLLRTCEIKLGFFYLGTEIKILLLGSGLDWDFFRRVTTCKITKKANKLTISKMTKKPIKVLLFNQNFRGQGPLSPVDWSIYALIRMELIFLLVMTRILLLLQFRRKNWLCGGIKSKKRLGGKSLVGRQNCLHFW